MAGAARGCAEIGPVELSRAKLLTLRDYLFRRPLDPHPHSGQLCVRLRIFVDEQELPSSNDQCCEVAGRDRPSN